MYIEYKYSSWRVVGFIYTGGGVITDPGETYLYNFPDIFLIFIFTAVFILV